MEEEEEEEEKEEVEEEECFYRGEMLSGAVSDVKRSLSACVCNRRDDEGEDDEGDDDDDEGDDDEDEMMKVR